MAHGGTLGTPFGGGAAVAEFDEVEHFIDVSGHILLRHRHRALAGVLAAHAGGQHRQRLRANGFAQAQVFVVADTERLVVAPQVEIVRPMLNITDGAIPVVHVIHAKTWVMQPPGKRMKRGCRSASALTKSGRKCLSPL